MRYNLNCCSHTPPGTSDEHLSVVKLLMNTKPEGAILVTSPQVLYCTILHVLYYAILYCTILCCIVLYCIVLYCDTFLIIIIILVLLP